MRVAFISQPRSRVTARIDNADSVAIWNYEVARRLAPVHEVTVYARGYPDQPRVEHADGVTYRRVRFSPLARRALRRLGGISGLEGPDFDSGAFHLSYIGRVAMDVRRRGCDVVHLHNFSQFAPVVRRLNPRVRIVLHMHCEWLAQLDRSVIARRLADVDLIVGCSNHITDGVRRRFPELSDRCTTVPNGVDADWLLPVDRPAERASEDRDLDVIFVGRVSPDKGVHDAVDAVLSLLPRVPRARLKVIGPDAVTPPKYLLDISDDPHVRQLAPWYERPYRELLQERVPAEHGDRVVFLGEVPRSRLRQHFASAGVLVQPSLTEPFGMSVVEAMAAGVPVVATRVGGMPEVLDHGRCALLVPPGDSRALAQAIVDLLSDVELRRRLTETGRRRVREGYTWDHVVRAVEDRYAAVVGGTSPAAGTG